jgi:hypothetical protein
MRGGASEEPVANIYRIQIDIRAGQHSSTVKSRNMRQEACEVVQHSKTRIAVSSFPVIEDW